MEDVQHRVRNNFQLIYAMLGKQLQSTSDPAGIEGLSAISRRIMTLVQLYDHVIGTGSELDDRFQHVPDGALLQCRIPGIRPAFQGEIDMSCGAGIPGSG